MGTYFLKKKSKITLASIILAIAGIIMMVGNSLSPGQMVGNTIAFLMPISFAILILVVRKYPSNDVDMVPLQLVAGIFAMIIGYLMSPTIEISSHDIFLGFLAGFFIGFAIRIWIYIYNSWCQIYSFSICIMLTEAVLSIMFCKRNPPLV